MTELPSKLQIRNHRDLPTNSESKGSIARAARVLDVLASMPQGASLSVIANSVEFTKTTTHRVLALLQQVNYVFQDPQSRMYHLGGKLVELSNTAQRANIAAYADKGMARLAEFSEDSIFLSIPEGALAICIARKTGAFPIRTLTLNKGDRRPLGVGAGSLALYCAMSDQRREAICRMNRNWMKEYGAFSHKFLEAERGAFLSQGYALNNSHVVQGTRAMALPIITKKGRLVASLAIGAINERMKPERIEKELLPALRREVELLSDYLNIHEEEPKR